MSSLKDKKVAILTDNGFEEEDLTIPKKALEEAGATVHVISLQKGKVKAWHHDHWSIEIQVDMELDRANSDDYDALMIPGGVINHDHMRDDIDYISFTQEFLESRKTVGAICDGMKLLLETGMIHNKEMVAFPSVKAYMESTASNWIKQDVPIDEEGIVTSRRNEALSDFNRKLIFEMAEGMHTARFAFAN